VTAVERIYHTWEKWECYPAGFYDDRPPNGMTQEQGEEKYREFLADLPAFERALMGVIDNWKHSCEHYLSNENMNRIAWLGQASMAYAHGIPSCCRGGFNRLTKEQQDAANALALKYLNIWRRWYCEPELTPDEAKSKTQMDLY
jgi:hypothetical protein